MQYLVAIKMELEQLFVLFTVCSITQGYAYFLTNDIDPIMGYEPDPAETKTYPKREFSHTSMHKKYFTGSNVIKFQKKDHEDIVDSHFKLLKPKTLRSPKEFQYTDVNMGLGDLNDKNEKMIVVTNAIQPPQPLQQVQPSQQLHQQPIQNHQPSIPSHHQVVSSGQQIHSITASPFNPQSQTLQVQPKPVVQTHQTTPLKQTTQDDKSVSPMNRRIQNFNSAIQGIQLNTNVLNEQKKFIRQNYMPSMARPNHGRYGTAKPSIERIARHDQMFPKMDYNKEGNFDHDFATFYRVPSQFSQGNLDQHDYGNGVFVGSYN